MFTLFKPRLSLTELSNRVINEIVAPHLAKDIKQLLSESTAATNTASRLNIMREYVAYRLFACYQGSRRAFGKADTTWKKFIAAIGESFSKALIRDGVFRDTNHFGSFLDQRSVEYHAALKEPPMVKGEAGNAIFALVVAFGNHVGVLDLAKLMDWGRVWVDWSIQDKMFVEIVLGEYRLVY